MTAAVAIAHPNIALSKYWGKRAGEGNFPAVPSLSLTLAGLSTKTRVELGGRGRDEVRINGALAEGESLARATALLDRVRAACGNDARAFVESTNDFPTASGLASSASGFAALALAATRAAGLDWDSERVSDLARQSSASAARSIFGGLVELAVGERSARALLPASAVDLRVVVCVTTEERKAHGSTDAMRKTAESSPYYRAWLERAPVLHGAIREAALAGDWIRAGALAEESALAMHGCALGAGFSYFRDASVRAIDAVRTLREGGARIFFTVDAGPHVKAFVSPEDAARAAEALALVPGVLRTIVCAPGEGARVEAP